MQLHSCGKSGCLQTSQRSGLYASACIYACMYVTGSRSQHLLRLQLSADCTVLGSKDSTDRCKYQHATVTTHILQQLSCSSWTSCNASQQGSMNGGQCPSIWPQAKACQLKALDMLSYVHTYLGFCYRLAAQPSLVHQLISRYVVTAQPVLTY